MKVPNRNWLSRVQRSMIGNYRNLEGIMQVDRDRRQPGAKKHSGIYTDEQLEEIREAKNHIGEAIDKIVYILELKDGE